MTHYQVWVEMTGGTGRILLTDTTDGQAAGDLVGALVSASQGASFEVGVSIGFTPGQGGTGGTTTPPPARQAQRR